MSDHSDITGIKRRGFLATSLLAAGAGLGLVARRIGPISPVPPAPSALDSRFAYDLSQFEKTDPAQLRYKSTVQFETGLSDVTRIAAGQAGIWVGGNRALKLFNLQGQLQRELALNFRPHAIQPIDQGALLIASKDFLVLLDSEAREKWRTAPLGVQIYFTALALHNDLVYAADAGSREVIVFSERSGELIDRFGTPQDHRSNPGFAIPSPYFDLRIASDHKLRIANTGRLRIETYSLDGRFESAWGEAGMQIDRFCGCCNPVFFTFTPQGDFITSEKGLARINIYSPSGQFKGAIAGPETLVEDKELARRACVDCRIGAGFDVAVDPQSSCVFTLDPYRKIDRRFDPFTA